MKKKLIDYRDAVGDQEIDEIFEIASSVRQGHVVMINSTGWGGGVAEILRSLIPLLNDSGPSVGWRTVSGHPDYFRVTKRIHNALQGDDIELTEEKKQVYEGVNEVFSQYTHIDHDLVVVHDPQPLPLIENYGRKQPWIWRCHLDLSNPNPEIWDYLKRFIIPYDFEIYQLESFSRSGSSHRIINPSIDPISTKNSELKGETVKEYLEKVEIGSDMDVPLIAQISRFDPWKDPFGVISVFDKVREEIDAKLVLAGAFPKDDPQAEGIYEKVIDKTKDRDDIIVAPNLHDIAVNSIQRAADVVLQKSLREGFGLTVSEAMWKETPVVGSNRGGIPEQIVDDETGYLVDPEDYDEVAEKILNILSDEQLKEEMGIAGRKRVKEKFLITRQVKDWLRVFSEFL